MKIPLSWLKEYVPLTVSIADLAERLTRAGLEVASVRCLGLPWPDGLKVKNVETGPLWERDKILVAEVLKVEKHPDADRLKLPTLAYGDGRTKTVVTGAANLHVGDAGQKVIIGLEGFQYFDGHATPKQLKRLKPTKMRGVPSDAMVCSSFELGIDEEHEGIIVLEPDAPVGTPLADFMGDYVLELELTPNLARCLSVIGVAREVAALTGQALTLPPHEVTATGELIDGKVKVAIEDAALSARYAAMLLRGVTVGPSPGWMQRRLAAAGMRPINNVVDVTNYVMLEWGQPLHAFDYDKLVARAGGGPPTITVRPARAGETLKTLDGQQRELTPEVLVIADGASPVALAGVMGGFDTEVSDATNNILLESANFDLVSIRRTARAFTLFSEASTRFSKGIHPELVAPAARRAAELMRRHGGATVCAGVVDAYPAKPVPRPITLAMAEVRRLLGMDIPRDECARILRTLEFAVETKGADALTVTPPPHRLDIQDGPADLIEDLVRLYGYDKLPATLLSAGLPPQSMEPPYSAEERARDLLVDAGLQECITYALTAPEREKLLGVSGEYVTLVNPISSERTAMRRTVLSGLLDVLANNLRHTDDARLFELGRVYLPRAGEKLPDEPRRLALALAGTRTRDFWGETVKAGYTPLDFYDLKGVVETLLAGLHVEGVAYRPVKTVPFLHPGQAAEVVVGEGVVGVFGLLHPRVARQIDLADRAVLVADLDVEALQAPAPVRHRTTPVPQFPPALRDIAVVVPENVSGEQILREIRAAGGDLLAEARLFDVYRGDSIPAGHKSLAYALVYQADRTLKDAEIGNAHKKIEERLKHVLKASIRSPKS